jgi:biopolymer transport protein ExbB/TolQ
MKKRAIISLFTLMCFVIPIWESSGQGLFNLREINSSAKELYIKPDALNSLMKRLKVIEKDIPAEDSELLLETYRIIADQYIANNHYSDAYDVYDRLITYKEAAVAAKFVSMIDSTKKNIEIKRLDDGTELMNLQNQVQQLQIDNDLLVSKRINFKKYFSFFIIALSAIFAIILMRSALKLIKIRAQLKENKEKMRSLHRISTLGSFARGMVNQSRQKAGQIEDLAQSIGTGLQSLASADQNTLALTTEIRSECKEIIKDFNASGINA